MTQKQLKSSNMQSTAGELAGIAIICAALALAIFSPYLIASGHDRNTPPAEYTVTYK